MSTNGAGATGVLLMGYGSPAGPADLPGYLAEILHHPPTTELVREYERRYALIGGSPQAAILAKVRDGVAGRLAREAPGVPVYLGTKHWHPNVSEVIPHASRDGVTRLVAVPLSPYASTWVLEPYRTALAAGAAAAPRPISVELAPGWNLEPSLIEFWAGAIRTALAEAADPTAVVHLSAHSLPKTHADQGDPYPGIVRATADAIAGAASLARWEFTFQSAGNDTEPWLGPDITEQMRRWKAKGARTHVVASFGFVFDHLEVLYDLDVVVRRFAEDLGLVYRRVPEPNADPKLIDALVAVAVRALRAPGRPPP
ncbi:MAG: ferrochelatase [Thermoplasmata archaeon]|nr:ferrochelatase [Thermoplasmata archaeon]